MNKVKTQITSNFSRERFFKRCRMNICILELVISFNLQIVSLCFVQICYEFSKYKKKKIFLPLKDLQQLT